MLHQVFDVSRTSALEIYATCSRPLCQNSRFFLHARKGDTCRLFSRGVIFTSARVSLALLSVRKNGGPLVVYTHSGVLSNRITRNLYLTFTSVYYLSVDVESRICGSPGIAGESQSSVSHSGHDGS